MPEGLVFISTCRCSHQNMQTLSSALALGKNASCFYQLLFRCNSRVMKDGLTVHSRYDMKASQVSVNSRMIKKTWSIYLMEYCVALQVDSRAAERPGKPNGILLSHKKGMK